MMPRLLWPSGTPVDERHKPPREFAVLLIVAILMATFCLVAFTLYVMPAHAQQSPPTPPATYTPTADQAKDLKIAQLETQNAYQQYQIAFIAWQQKTAALKAAGDKVKADNKWPDAVTFNSDAADLSKAFAVPPAPALLPKPKP